MKLPQWVKFDPVILSDEQYEALLRECAGRPMLYLYTLLLGESGLRTYSEALRLRWEDVDLTEGFIRVRGRQAKRTDGRTKSVRVSNPYSVFKGNVRYAVTEDEMEVPYVVRARIEKS